MRKKDSAPIDLMHYLKAWSVCEDIIQMVLAWLLAQPQLAFPSG